MADTTTSICYFLELPPELRNHIYKFALKRVTTIWARLHENRNFTTTFRLSKYNAAPPLTMTCRATRREALPLYYAINTLAFSITPLDPRPYAPKLKPLGKLAPFATHLKNIEIEIPCSHKVVYTVDLSGRVSTRSMWAGLLYDADEKVVGCICQTQNIIDAQALVNDTLVGKRAGEGWSVVDLVRLITLLREGHRPKGQNGA